MFEGTVNFWEHHSKETKTDMKFSTFIPANKVKGALIWLSGLTCTEENFMIKAGAQKYLTNNNLMIICPDTSPRGLNLPGEHDGWDFGSGASFYLDALTEGYRDHYKMESYIVSEIVEVLEKHFGVSKNKISLMGHSMGGHGALVLGLRHPNVFQSISAFSPVSHPTHCPWGVKAFSGYLGPDESLWMSHDATELLRSGKRHPQRILIDQGENDEFLQNQLKLEDFKKACSESTQEAEINIRSGYDHSYYFIASYIESHITFHAKALTKI